MRDIISSIEKELRRYKELAEGAMSQLGEPELNAVSPGFDNSIAILVWHISGNFKSRFTDFLTADGEKPWRGRDEEFVARTVNRAELLERWEDGWRVLFTTLGALKDDDLKRSVTIRRQPLTVCEALHRSLGHVSYHVGQIVYIAKSTRGAAWTFMSIPPGQSEK
jgi:hypothetical protein